MFGPKRKLEALAEAELLRLRLTMRGTVIRIAVLLFAAFLALIGFALASAAIAFALSELYGAPLGALIAAGIAFLVAALLALLSAPLSRSRERKSAEAASRAARQDIADDIAAVKSLADGLGSCASGEHRRGVKPLVVGALAAGFVVGFSPRLQRLIFGRRNAPPPHGD